MSVTQSRYRWCDLQRVHPPRTAPLRLWLGMPAHHPDRGIFIPIWLLISLCETLSNPPRCQKCGGGHTSIVQAITMGILLLMIGVGAVGWLMMDSTKKQSAAFPPAPPIPAAAEGELAKPQPAPVPAKPAIVVEKVPAKPAIVVDKSVAAEADAIEKERNDAIHARDSSFSGPKLGEERKGRVGPEDLPRVGHQVPELGPGEDSEGKEQGPRASAPCVNPHQKGV